MTSVSTPIARTSFAEIWQQSSEQLRAGNTKVDIEPPQRWPLYSFVCRVPTAVGARAVDALLSDGPAWAEHYIYPPSTVHMTVLFLTPYLGIGSQTDPDYLRIRIAEAEEIARDVFESFGPMNFRAHGLSAFPSTVFLQLIPEDQAMPYRLRRTLADRLRAAAFPDATPADYEVRKPLHLAYGNIARFRHPLIPSLLTSIESNRDRDFGEVTFDSVELVRSDKLLSEENTELLSRYKLS
jgi:2'-5' RNA ligase